MRKTVIESFTNVAAGTVGTLTVESRRLSIVSDAGILEVKGHATGTIILANIYGVGQAQGAPNRVVLNVNYAVFGTVVPVPTGGTIPGVKLLLQGA
jgi:hypothetical protein